MNDNYEIVELSEQDMLQMASDVRRAMLEDAPVPDVALEFRKFQSAQSQFLPANSTLAVSSATKPLLGRRQFRVGSLVALGIAASLLAFFVLRMNRAVSPEQDEPVTVFAATSQQESEVAVVASGQTVSMPLSAKQPVSGLQVDAEGEIHITPTTDVADEDRTTLLIPRGRVARLQLSDGTRVWLSANSRLIFPRHFLSKGPREVALVGEAYFEVARNEQQPFVVNCDGLQTTVLGTRFNVRSYDDGLPQVVLLSGIVEVKSANGESLRLEPDQAATLAADGTVSVSEADSDVVLGWTRGEFYFDGQTMREIMQEIGRWYNCTVVFNGKKHLDDKLHFNSDRSLPLEEVVRQMNAISNAKIALEDGKLVVF